MRGAVCSPTCTERAGICSAAARASRRALLGNSHASNSSWPGGAGGACIARLQLPQAPHTTTYASTAPDLQQPQLLRAVRGSRLGRLLARLRGRCAVQPGCQLGCQLGVRPGLRTDLRYDDAWFGGCRRLSVGSARLGLARRRLRREALAARARRRDVGGCLLRGRGLIVQPHRVRVPCRLIPRSVGRDAHPVGLDVEDDTTLAPRSVASRHP